MPLKLEPFNHKKHDYKAFTCGAKPQDDFIHKFAKQHTAKGISKTHVLVDTDQGAAIVGYITLTACHVLFHDLDPRHQAKYPHYPIPGVRLCQLAVSSDYRGVGYGEMLVAEAANRARSVRDNAGVSLLVADIQDNDPRLAKFYESLGFFPCAISTGTLYLPLGKPGT